MKETYDNYSTKHCIKIKKSGFLAKCIVVLSKVHILLTERITKLFFTY